MDWSGGLSAIATNLSAAVTAALLLIISDKLKEFVGTLYSQHKAFLAIYIAGIVLLSIRSLSLAPAILVASLLVAFIFSGWLAKNSLSLARIGFSQSVTLLDLSLGAGISLAALVAGYQYLDYLQNPSVRVTGFFLRPVESRYLADSDETKRSLYFDVKNQLAKTLEDGGTSLRVLPTISSSDYEKLSGIFTDADWKGFRPLVFRYYSTGPEQIFLGAFAIELTVKSLAGGKIAYLAEVDIATFDEASSSYKTSSQFSLITYPNNWNAVATVLSTEIILRIHAKSNSRQAEVRYLPDHTDQESGISSKLTDLARKTYDFLEPKPNDSPYVSYLTGSSTCTSLTCSRELNAYLMTFIQKVTQSTIPDNASVRAAVATRLGQDASAAVVPKLGQDTSATAPPPVSP